MTPWSWTSKCVVSFRVSRKIGFNWFKGNAKSKMNIGDKALVLLSNIWWLVWKRTSSFITVNSGNEWSEMDWQRNQCQILTSGLLPSSTGRSEGESPAILFMFRGSENVKNICPLGPWNFFSKPKNSERSVNLINGWKYEKWRAPFFGLPDWISFFAALTSSSAFLFLHTHREAFYFQEFHHYQKNLCSYQSRNKNCNLL